MGCCRTSRSWSARQMGMVGGAVRPPAARGRGGVAGRSRGNGASACAVGNGGLLGRPARGLRGRLRTRSRLQSALPANSLAPLAQTRGQVHAPFRRELLGTPRKPRAGRSSCDLTRSGARARTCALPAWLFRMPRNLHACRWVLGFSLGYLLSSCVAVLCRVIRGISRTSFTCPITSIV
jgi:hypothetical protein